MAELNQSDAQGWLKWLTNFDSARKAWTENYDALYNLRPWVAQHQPSLLAEHDALLNRYRAQASQVQMLSDMRETVARWLTTIPAIANAAKNVITLQFPIIGASMTAIQAGMDKLKSTFGLGALGIAPIVVAVGLAAATAAVIAIAQLVADTWKYSQRLNALGTLQAQGMTPDQAAATVNKVLGAPGDPNTFMGLPVGTLAVAAVLIVLGPKVVDLIGERGK